MSAYKMEAKPTAVLKGDSEAAAYVGDKFILERLIERHGLTPVNQRATCRYWLITAVDSALIEMQLTTAQEMKRQAARDRAA
jgi:hypothetical protein